MGGVVAKPAESRTIGHKHTRTYKPRRSRSNTGLPLIIISHVESGDHTSRQQDKPSAMLQQYSKQQAHPHPHGHARNMSTYSSRQNVQHNAHRIKNITKFFVSLPEFSDQAHTRQQIDRLNPLGAKWGFGSNFLLFNHLRGMQPCWALRVKLVARWCSGTVVRWYGGKRARLCNLLAFVGNERELPLSAKPKDAIRRSSVL